MSVTDIARYLTNPFNIYFVEGSLRVPIYGLVKKVNRDDLDFNKQKPDKEERASV